jgi:DNA-binding winged helix-turn-helix (wHTH) protein
VDQGWYRHFGEYWVDRYARSLYRNGERVKLDDRSVQLLMLLLERRGQVVSRDDICQRLFPPDRQFNGYARVDAMVSRLEAVLGDTAGRPRLIGTVFGKGYVFQDVTRTQLPVVDDHGSVERRGSAQGCGDTTNKQRTGRWRPRSHLFAVLLGLLVVSLAVAVAAARLWQR